MVRAKMTANVINTETAPPTVHLNAVYEGSSELQGISENAIFGNATPCGSCTLRTIAPFELNEEYYLDIEGGADAESNGADGVVFVTTLTKAHEDDIPVERSEWTRENFRLVGESVQVHLAIANPKACDYLRRFDSFSLVIRKALGRRSDAEIALRAKMLAEFDAEAAKEGSWWKANPQPAANHRAMLVKQLARAKGEI